MKTKLRPLGQVTADMELLLQEMTDAHELQYGEIIALIFSWLEIHAPHAKEVYTEDGSSPSLIYRHVKK
jgi:hypothetical protein